MPNGIYANASQSNYLLLNFSSEICDNVNAATWILFWSLMCAEMGIERFSFEIANKKKHFYEYILLFLCGFSLRLFAFSYIHAIQIIIK